VLLQTIIPGLEEQRPAIMPGLDAGPKWQRIRAVKKAFEMLAGELLDWKLILQTLKYPNGHHLKGCIQAEILTRKVEHTQKYLVWTKTRFKDLED